jgi:hypothetical protein
MVKRKERNQGIKQAGMRVGARLVHDQDGLS